MASNSHAQAGGTTVAAPGKLLLFGEHAAVHGFPAVGVTLNRSLSLTATPADATTFRILSARDGGSGPDVDTTRMAPFIDHIHSVLPGWRPADLTVSSDIPLSSGFGSSAALCVTLARLYHGVATPVHTVWETAHALERFFHGTPSGVDTGLSARTGVVAFSFGESATVVGHSGEEVGAGTPSARAGLAEDAAEVAASGGLAEDAAARSAPAGSAEVSAPFSPPALPTVRPLDVTLPPLVYGSIPRTRTARELIAHVSAQVATDRAMRDALEDLGAIAAEVIDQLPLTARELATRANRAHARLQQLGVSTAELDAVIATGTEAGALGGKLSGAGGGGAFYLVCEHNEDARRIASTLRSRAPAGSVVLYMESSSEIHQA